MPITTSYRCPSLRHTGAHHYVITVPITTSYRCPSLRQNDPSGRADKPACWDCRFQSRREHVCLSLVSDVCCQVEVFTMGQSLVQRSFSECVCVSLCVIRHNNNPVHIKWVGSRDQNKKEAMKETLYYVWHTILSRPSIKSNFTLHTRSRKLIYFSRG